MTLAEDHLAANVKQFDPGKYTEPQQLLVHPGRLVLGFIQFSYSLTEHCEQ
jgi:hypothetical protein